MRSSSRVGESVITVAGIGEAVLAVLAAVPFGCVLWWWWRCVGGGGACAVAAAAMAVGAAVVVVGVVNVVVA